MNNLLYAAEVILCTCARDEVRAVQRLSAMLREEIGSNRVTLEERRRAVELLNNLEDTLQESARGAADGDPGGEGSANEP